MKTLRQAAVDYIKSLEPDDREALKIMVLNGVQVAHDYAKRNNITASQLTQELKQIFTE